MIDSEGTLLRSTTGGPDSFVAVLEMPQANAFLGPADSIFAVDQSGHVSWSHNGAPSSFTSLLDEPVRDVRFGVDHGVFAITDSGLFRSEIGTASEFALVNSQPDSTLTFRSDGSVYLLEWNGRLLRSPNGLPGTFHETISESVTSFTFGPDNSVYVKSGQRLWRSDTGEANTFAIVHEGAMTQLTFAPDKSVYFLDQNARLLRSVTGAPGTFRVVVNDDVTDFLIAADGSVYVSAVRRLWRSATDDENGFTSIFEGSFERFELGPDGISPYLLTSDRRLLSSPGRSFTSFQDVVNESVASFEFGSDGSIYVATKERLMWSPTGARETFEVAIEQPIESLTFGPDDAVYALTLHGEVWRAPGRGSHTFTLILSERATKVLFGPDRALYVLSPQKLLRSELGTVDSFDVISDKPVERVDFGGNGRVLMLRKDGRLLWSPNGRVDTFNEAVSVNVASFVVDTAEAIYVMAERQVWRSASGEPGSYSIVSDEPAATITFGADNRVYIHEKDGGLTSSATGEPGTYNRLVDERVFSFHFGPGDAMYLLTGTNVLRSETGERGSFNVVSDEPAVSLVFGRDESVFIFEKDGGLTHSDTGVRGTFHRPLEDLVLEYQFGPRGEIFVVTTTGVLRSQSGGPGSFSVVNDEPVARIVFGPEGDVFLWEKDGGLTHSATGVPGSYNAALDSNDKLVDLRFGPDGVAYVQTENRLLRSAADEPGKFVTIDDEPVSALTFGVQGSVYVLENDGTLLRSPDGRPGTFEAVVDEVVNRFLLGPDSAVYLMTTQQLIRSETGVRGSFVVVDDEPIADVYFASDGGVYVLEKDGGFLYSARGQPGTYHGTVNEPVMSFAFGPDNSVYVVTANRLWRSATGDQGSYVVIDDEPVSTFTFGSHGDLYVLEKDGTLLRSPSGLPGTLQRTVDEAVDSFTFGPDDAVYVLTSQRLRRSDTGQPDSFTVIDDESVSSLSFGPDGAVYITETDGGFVRWKDGRAVGLISQPKSLFDDLVPLGVINDLEDSHRLVAGDFDGNGRTDLAYVDIESGNNRIIFNQSDWNFVPQDNVWPAGAVNQIGGERFVLAGDFDGNGRSDLLYFHKETGENRAVFSKTDGTFESRDGLIPLAMINGLRETYLVVAGDFDNNGFDDLLYVHKETGENRVVFNQGNGLSQGNAEFSVGDNFVPRGAINDLRENYFLVAGDFDGNGFCDLLYIHKNTGTNRALLNLGNGLSQGNGEFATRDDFLAPGAVNDLFDRHLVAAGDFDGNGDSDFIYVHKTTGANRIPDAIVGSPGPAARVVRYSHYRDDSLLWLESDGDFYRWHDDEKSLMNSEPVSSFSIGPDGAVYEVERDGGFVRWDGDGRQLSTDLVVGFAFYRDDSVFWLESDGDLFRLVNNQKILMNSEPVSSFAIGPDGAVYEVERDGGFVRWDGDGSQLSSDLVTGFEFYRDGSVFWLESDGDFYRWKDFRKQLMNSEPVASFVTGPDGAIYEVERNGGFVRWDGEGRQLSSDVISNFAFGDDNSVTWLEADDDLYRFQTDVRLLGRNYLSFRNASNGTVIGLQTGGDLAKFHADGTGDILGRGYQSFQVAPDGSVIALQNSGDLAKFLTNGTGNVLGRGYKAFEVAPDGSVIALQHSGDLAKFHADGTGDILGAGINRFKSRRTVR